MQVFVKFFWWLTVLLSVTACVAQRPVEYLPRAGDFLFQSLPHADLVDAIEGVTESSYSHVGLLIRENDTWLVREAIGRVRDTPLQDWIERGREQKFDVYRLKPEMQVFIPKAIEQSRTYLRRPYDFKYAMDDESIYCSELLYKSFLSVSGKALGTLITLGSLNWRPFQTTIEKYEQGTVPIDRLMITPVDLSQAPELQMVYQSMDE